MAEDHGLHATPYTDDPRLPVADPGSEHLLAAFDQHNIKLSRKQVVPMLSAVIEE